jgi:hypothetical protein
MASRCSGTSLVGLETANIFTMWDTAIPTLKIKVMMILINSNLQAGFDSHTLARDPMAETDPIEHGTIIY